MSSPAAAASGGNGDAGQAQQGEAAQGEAQQGPDLNALAEQLGQHNESLEGMRQFLQSQPWQQQADAGAEGEQEAGAEGLDLSFLDDAGYDQQTAAQLADVIERQMAQREAALTQQFEKKLDGVTERVSERERMEQMRDLVDEFPDMANPEVAKPVVAQAHSLVEANGWPEQLAADPRFWRIAYAAQQAFAAAQEEGADDGSAAAHLEGGAGASGARAAQQGDDFKQMLDDASKGGRQALPFP